MQQNTRFFVISLPHVFQFMTTRFPLELHNDAILCFKRNDDYQSFLYPVA